MMVTRPTKNLGVYNGSINSAFSKPTATLGGVGANGLPTMQSIDRFQAGSPMMTAGAALQMKLEDKDMGLTGVYNSQHTFFNLGQQEFFNAASTSQRLGRDLGTPEKVRPQGLTQHLQKGDLNVHQFDMNVSRHS